MKSSWGYLLSILVLISGLILGGCQGPSSKNEAPKTPTPPPPLRPSFALKEKNSDEISVMTFNVENLFDSKDDPGVNDESFLPLALKQNAVHQERCAKITNEFYRRECLELDWNENVIHQKMKNISDVLLQVDGGRGADIVLIQEIENKELLAKLNQNYLQKGEYQTVALEQGFDTRGINVGLLSRLPLVGQPKLHRIPFSKENERIRTRGILEVSLLSPQGREIVVFVAHFPSQSNPTSARQEAHLFLLSLMNRHEGKMIIAGGDLNTTELEEKSFGYFSQIYQNPGRYYVSHLYGCRECPGTHVFKNEWGFLDILIFPQYKEQLGFEISPEKIDVLRTHPTHVNALGIPQRFDPVALTGVSDHAPKYLRMKEFSSHRARQ